LKSWIVGKSASRKNYWVILFLCTVKNNRRKFVDFALRKSNFLFDVYVGNLPSFTFQKIQSFFMKISEDLWSPVSFHMNSVSIGIKIPIGFGRFRYFWKYRKVPTVFGKYFVGHDDCLSKEKKHHEIILCVQQTWNYLIKIIKIVV
jgi:hypothetical protein